MWNIVLRFLFFSTWKNTWGTRRTSCRRRRSPLAASSGAKKKEGARQQINTCQTSNTFMVTRGVHVLTALGWNVFGAMVWVETVNRLHSSTLLISSQPRFKFQQKTVSYRADLGISKKKKKSFPNLKNLAAVRIEDTGFSGQTGWRPVSWSQKKFQGWICVQTNNLARRKQTHFGLLGHWFLLESLLD